MSVNPCSRWAVYYFRVVPDGDEWLCKRGSRVIQRFETVIEALDLAEVEAAVHAPSEVVYYDPDGGTTVIAAYPEASPPCPK